MRRGAAPERRSHRRTKRRTHSPEYRARVAMEAISGRKTIQADRCRPRHPSDPGEPVEATASRRCQRAVHQG
ncbi:protein of unknown function [Cyanobium sp. NIES-981]|nr:protein of unknown function [Cyanobium sp. NIES-981]